MSTDTADHNVFALMRIREKVAFGLVLLFVTVGFGFDMSDQPTYESWKGWLLAFFGCLFLYATVPSILRSASKGSKSVWTVCGASIAVLVVTLVVFYTCYFWIVGALPPAPVVTPAVASDKILNFPPMIAAVWAAGMGWYVHFQASAKNHRTTNSFNLLMQTRTSKEFTDHARQASIAYPHGVDVPVEDEELIKSSKLLHFTVLVREQEAEGEVEPELRNMLVKAQGAEGLKYLLNFYEFMAVGVAAKDLDEEMLYETICVTVNSVYRRSKALVDYVRRSSGGDQSLAFDKLEALVERWEVRLQNELHAKKKTRRA